jgi:hypothetical protein
MSSRSLMPIFALLAVGLMTAAVISGTAGTAAAAPGPDPTPSPASSLAVPTINPNPVNSVLSFDNQHPAVSGTVTELEPGGTAPVPYANQPVSLVDSRLDPVQVMTDANGAFSFAPYASPLPGETFDIEVPATASTAAAQTTPVTFTLQTDPVKLTATLSATKICYCGRASVSGTVSYAPDGNYQPLAGQPVQVFAYGVPVALAVSDASGHFSVSLPREQASLTWTVQAGGGSYLGTASVRLPMTVYLPTVISGFQLSLNQYWQVSFHGCLSLAAGIPGQIGSLAGLVIQYSPTRNGLWHTLGTVPQRRGRACGNDGVTFSGVLNARLSYSYYRVVYAGGTNGAGTGYLPATSNKVLAWKYADRITGFRVSASTLRKGAKLTVSGRLQFYASGWRNFGRAQVQVILRPKGSRTWYWIARVKTNSSGNFTVTFGDPVSATWAVEYLGDKTHLDAISATTYVRVTG